MSQGLEAPRESRADDGRPSLSLLLTRSESAVRARLLPTLTEAELSFEDWLILSVLADRPGLRMSEIADSAVVPTTSLTRHMDRLVERALVIRRVDPEDKRRAVCALSARGTEMVSRIRVEEHSLEHALARTLGADAYTELTRQLAVATELLR